MRNIPSHFHSTVLYSVLPVASCCDQGKESKDARLDATVQQSFRQRAGQVLEEPERSVVTFVGLIMLQEPMVVEYYRWRRGAGPTTDVYIFKISLQTY